MNDLLASSIVIIVTACFVAGLFLYLSYRKKQETEALFHLATEQRWTLTTVQERLVSGYRIEGSTEGTAWHFESLAYHQDTSAAPGSSEIQNRIAWQCGEIGLAAGVAAVGPRVAGAQELPEMNGWQAMVMEKAMRLIFGKESASLKGIHPVAYGSAEFQKIYMAWAQKADDIDHLLRGTSEETLLCWRGNHQLLIKLTGQGLELSLPQATKIQPDDIIRLVKLGTNMVRSWKTMD